MHFFLPKPSPIDQIVAILDVKKCYRSIDRVTEFLLHNSVSLAGEGGTSNNSKPSPSPSDKIRRKPSIEPVGPVRQRSKSRIWDLNWRLFSPSAVVAPVSNNESDNGGH